MKDMTLFEQTAVLFTALLLYVIVMLEAMPNWVAVVLALLAGAALLRQDKIKNQKKKTQTLMLSLGVLIVSMFTAVLMK
ncbi:MAG: hypothetical protein ACT4QE_12400 [Anaerolineales bacterium]